MPAACALIEKPECLEAASVTALQAEFSRSPYRPLRQMRCCWHKGRVAVHGTVPSFYLKQLAVATAARVAGVGRVLIEIDVCDESPAPLPGGDG